MAFTDFRTAALDQLWELLGDADAGVFGTTDTKVRSGNAIDPREATGFKRENMERTAPGDFPRLIVQDAGLGPASYADGGDAFAAELLDGPDGFSQPVAFGLAFDVTLQTAVAPGATPMAVYSPLESAAFQALVRGGPRLGLYFVVRWRMEIAKPPAPVDLPGGHKGYEGKYRVALSCIAESRLIITPA